MKEKKLRKGTPEYEIEKLRYAVEWREKYIAQLKRNIEAHEELEGIYSAWMVALVGAAGTVEISKEELSRLIADKISLEVKETDSRYQIHVSSDAADVPVSQEMLDRLVLYTQAGSAVSMDALSDLVMETELSSISHTDRAVSMSVSAQLTGESTTGISRRVEKYIASHPLPDGVSTDVGGIDELIGDSMGPLIQALLISLFLVYMVIVLIYERFDQPLLIMLTVPFCVIGVVLSLAVFGSSMSMVSLLGVVTLGGMLVNNGIILVDYINQLEDSSRSKEAEEKGIVIREGEKLLGKLSYESEMTMLFENIRKGTATRLRPILMSSLTTILGVIPMAFAKGEGAEIYAPLGQVIMGGLTTSTFITLFLMPTFYFILERHKIRKAYGWKRVNGKEVHV